MGVMILPLVVVLVAGLLVLGMVCAERFPVRSWPSRIRSVVRNSQEVRLAEQDVEVEDAAERTRGSAGSRRRAQAHEPATGGLSQPQS